MAVQIKIGEQNFHNFALQNETASLNGFATALGIATALAVATVLAFATIVAALATALPFTTVFALAVVFAIVAARRIRARRVGVLRVNFRADARQQSGDGRADEECSLCSGHNVYFVGLCLRPRR
jgi:uncharacterized protein (DUF58 family)